MIRGLRYALALLAVVGSFAIGGCTDESSRNTLTVVSLNDGDSFASDLLNEADTSKIFIPVDLVPVELGNIPNGGGDPIAPGDPYSEIVVTGYTVTYANGIYSPVSGGMNLRIPSGGKAAGSIALSNIADKAVLPLSTASTTTATVHFSGYNYINGIRNGDSVWAEATITVQVANFGDQ
jgi:hypothetical protein